MRRFLTLFAVGVAVCAAVATAPPAAAVVPPPNLRGYDDVAVEQFMSGDSVYFRTPDGLQCAILTIGYAGCSGRLPAVAPEVNEIVVSSDVPFRGLVTTASPRFLAPPGDVFPILQDGQKLVLGDFECAVGPGSQTACTKAGPVTHYFVVSPAGTGVGPATAGLPPGMPDPNDFVAVNGETYLVGESGKYFYPGFTVDPGLTCTINVISSGSFGCDGTLPLVTGGENEVFANVPGSVGIRRTTDPLFDAAFHPGPIRQLPVGQRVHGIGAQGRDALCMAIVGGVACYSDVGGGFRGFVVDASGVETFPG